MTKNTGATMSGRVKVNAKTAATNNKPTMGERFMNLRNGKTVKTGSDCSSNRSVSVNSRISNDSKLSGNTNKSVRKPVATEKPVENEVMSDSVSKMDVDTFVNEIIDAGNGQVCSEKVSGSKVKLFDLSLIHI